MGSPDTHGLSYEIGLLLLRIVCLKCGKAWEWFLNTPSCCPRKAQTQFDLGNCGDGEWWPGSMWPSKALVVGELFPSQGHLRSLQIPSQFPGFANSNL